MKTVLKTIAGGALFSFLVLFPMRAKLAASFVNIPGVGADAQAAILRYALDFDRCSVPILERLGDALVESNKHLHAAMVYGAAMTCSPGHPIMRFKYGEALLSMGYIEGGWFVEEALTLEPNNPIYQSEVRRFKALLSQSPSPGLPQ